MTTIIEKKWLVSQLKAAKREVRKCRVHAIEVAIRIIESTLTDKEEE